MGTFFPIEPSSGQLSAETFDSVLSSIAFARARRTSLGISRALFDRHRGDPCVRWPIGCGAHAADSLSAILYGTSTTVFPWFLMFPSQRMGWLGRDAPVGLIWLA